MKVGDIVYKRPEFGAAKGQQSVPPQEARVVYIHPKKTVLLRQVHVYPRRRYALVPAVLPAAESDHRLVRRREARDAERKPRHPRGAVDQISKPAEQGAYFPVKRRRRKKRKK